MFCFPYSVGDAIGAFAAQMLKGSVPPGVYFPEEVPGKSFREEILADISADAITYSIVHEADSVSGPGSGSKAYTYKV